MNIKSMLKDFSESFGVGGYYDDIHFVAGKYLEEVGETSIDKNGNILCKVIENKNAKHNILLDAHLDEIGFMVTYITDDGYLKISPVGGVDRRLIVGDRLTILGKTAITGIISAVAPHLKSKVNDSKAKEITDMFLDVGMNKEQVSEIVELGDYAVFGAKCQELANDCLTGKSLDNRAGCVSVIYGAYLAKQANLKDINLTILLSVKEEVNASGAMTGCYPLEIDSCICVDVTFAKAPNIKPEQCSEMGKGTVIGIAPVVNRQMFEKLKNLAKTNEIDYTVEVMSGRTGTNADTIASDKHGIATAMLSIPLKNMHSTVEIIKMSDLEKTSQLICEYIKEVNNEQ